MAWRYSKSLMRLVGRPPTRLARRTKHQRSGLCGCEQPRIGNNEKWLWIGSVSHNKKDNMKAWIENTVQLVIL